MTKHKIITGKEPVSSEEIAKRRDFESILKSVKKVPFYQKPIFLASIAAGVVIVAAINLFFILKKDPNINNSISKDTKNAVEAPAKTEINPPMPEVNFAYQVFEAKNDEETNWKSERGSTVHIPKNALVDKNGKLIKGKVEVKFREMHDAIDFFLSGIPMTYDSAGRKYVFESAGMVELLAFQDNEPVFLASGKNATINLVSDQQGDKYNLYQFDTAVGNWVIKGKDKVNIIKPKKVEQEIINEIIPIYGAQPSLTENRQEIKQEIKKLEQKKPEEPRKYDPAKNYIALGLDVKEFPELAVYKDVKFEVGKENKAYNPKDVSAVVWEGADLTKGEAKGSYNLTLKKGKRELNYIVYPALDGEDYEQAQKNYEQKFKDYKVTAAKKKEELRLLNEKIEEERRKANEFVSANNKIQRTIVAANFGIFNCDAPWYPNFPAMVQADFTDEKGNTIKLKTMYMADKQRNAIINLFPTENISFRYDPAAQHKIWGLTSNNKLAIVTEKGLKTLSSAPQNARLEMKIIEEKLASAEDVKKLINL